MVTYADRPWLKHYNKATPATLEYPEHPVHEFLRQTARRIPDHTALITSAHLPLFGRKASTMTYAELDRLSDALAVGLVDLGLKKGSRVALLMPNTPAFIISYYAVLKAGGVVSATNPTYPAERMQHQLNDCDTEIIITLSLFYDTVKKVQPETNIKTVIVTNIKEYLPPLARFLFTLAREKKDGHYIETLSPDDLWFQDVLSRRAGQKPNIEVALDDVALFQYTGGTTGVSKAAVVTHRNLVANTIQMKVFLDVDDVPGEEEVFLGAIPMFHVFGMVAVLGLAVALGAKTALVPNARDIDDLLDTIDHYQPTLFHGVPALYNAINNHPKVQAGEINLRSIRTCMSGSAPVPPSTKHRFEQLSGATVIEGFGMSEAPTATHCNPLRGKQRTGAIGIPLSDMDMRIVSLEDGETDVPVGESGELLMAGPQIMRGYHNMPAETDEALREKDGKIWLYTGDIARMDEDGFFYIVDRKKDMALIGGFNVYPTLVEKVLSDHPAVLEVGVASIPHPEKEGQEALKAWVVLKPNETITEQELIEHSSERLAHHEIPTRYAFIDALPKTAVGKVLRRELVNMEQLSPAP